MPVFISTGQRLGLGSGLGLCLFRHAR